MVDPADDDDIPDFPEVAARLDVLLQRLLVEKTTVKSEDVLALGDLRRDALDSFLGIDPFVEAPERPALDRFFQALNQLDQLVYPSLNEDYDRAAEANRYSRHLFHERDWPLTPGGALLLIKPGPPPSQPWTPGIESAVTEVVDLLPSTLVIEAELQRRAVENGEQREIGWECAADARRRLATKFRSLAERFRIVAARDAPSDEFEAAAEEGVRLSLQLADAGFPHFRRTSGFANEVMRAAGASTQWSLVIVAFRELHPDRFPSRAERATYSGIREDDRVVLSYDFASACEEIADLIDENGKLVVPEGGSEMRTEPGGGASDRAVSHALERALLALCEGLREPRRLWDRLLRFVDEDEVNEVVRRFAKEFARAPARRAELERRASFLKEATREGSSFAEELDRIRRTLAKATKGNVERPTAEAEALTECRDRLDAIRAKLPLFYGAGVRAAVGTLESYGNSGFLPSDVRCELSRLASRAQDLDDEAERDACDGCHVIDAALYASTPEGAVDPKAWKPSDFGGGMLEPIQAAAESLIAWAREARVVESDAAVVKRKRTPPATVSMRVAELYEKNRDARGWTAKQVAAELKCSPSSVVATASWKQYATPRGEKKARAAMAAHRRSFQPRD